MTVYSMTLSEYHKFLLDSGHLYKAGDVDETRRPNVFDPKSGKTYYYTTEGLFDQKKKIADVRVYEAETPVNPNLKRVELQTFDPKLKRRLEEDYGKKPVDGRDKFARPEKKEYELTPDQFGKLTKMDYKSREQLTAWDYSQKGESGTYTNGTLSAGGKAVAEYKAYYPQNSETPKRYTLTTSDPILQRQLHNDIRVPPKAQPLAAEQQKMLQTMAGLMGNQMEAMKK